MASDTTFPASDVTPSLFDDQSPCNSTMPGGEVVEWFDFGQFIELVAVDAAGVSHPVVLTNESELTRTAGAIGDEVSLPTRTVDILGGIPIAALADQSQGHGESALEPISQATEISVVDVDDLIRTGILTTGSKKYRISLETAEARDLADGQPVLKTGALLSDNGSEPVVLRLVPEVVDYTVHDVDSLIAARQVHLGAGDVSLSLEAAEVKMLLEGRTVVVRGKTSGRTVLIRLNQATTAVAGQPARIENSISDLAAFLANPVIDAIAGPPIPVPLSKDNVHELRTAGASHIALTNQTTITLRVISTSSQPLMMIRRNGAGGGLGGGQGDIDSGSSGSGSSPGVSPVSPAVTDATVTLGGSSSSLSRILELADNVRGDEKIVRFVHGTAPLPIPPSPTAPPKRPPFHVQVALFLPWRQTWRLKGLSRGRLLHSLSLAPQEETTIEMSTWERRRRSLEQSSETETEQDIEGTDSTKDTNEVYSEVQKQSDFQAQIGASLRATYRPAAGEIEVGANAQLSVKNSVNQIGKNTQQRIHEAVIKSATKVRSRRTTKITETVESGSEQKVTRKIRNPNQCHTLNLDYYEVLAHYTITTEFLSEDTRLCAMIQNPVSVDTFSTDLVLRNETALRDALIDRALTDGFDAIRLLSSYSEATLELADRRAAAAGAARIGSPEQPPPPPSNDPKPTKEQSDVLAALQSLRSAASTFSKSYGPAALLNAIGNHDNIAEADRQEARRWMYQNLVSAKFPSFGTALAGLVTPGTDAASTDFNVALEAARRFGATCPSSTGSPTLAGLNDLSDADKENAGLAAAIKQHMAAAWDWAWWSGRCREEKMYVADDMGVPAAVQRLLDKLLLLDAAPTVADKASEQGDAKVAQANQNQSQDSAENMLEMKFPLEDIGKARSRRNTLLAHLNEHINFYRYALFQALPPSEQLDKLMSNSGGALRVGMFEPRVVSVHGSLLAVPLNSGNEALIAAFQANMISTLKGIGHAEDTIMLPTPGMTIESRLGRCSACEEFIEQSRSIELRRLSALARQQEAEADRRTKRINSTAPNLDPFVPTDPRLNIGLEQVVPT